MSALNETYTLSNGVEIPKLGLGTWFIDDDKASDAVRAAIETGYRNIDTAQAYGTEHGVGEGIRTSGVVREDLFVSTKLAAEIKDYDAAAAAIDESLAKLDIGYIDLMLIHAPQPWDDFRGGDYTEGNRQAWRALEDAHKAGKIRAIGVSNFLQSDLENILAHGTVAPHVNQVLLHAGNTPAELLGFCTARNILVQAYSPIAHGALLNSRQITAIAEKYEVSVPQLCIRYALQLGTQPLPKTALRMLDERDYGEHAAFPVYSGK
jgi:diketogulonate reductase-like aldo/keto reductase